MYTITAILWSYENGQLVYDEETLFSINTQDDRPVVAANGSFELSEGGSVQFTLAYTHPLYNELTPLETYIRVTDDSEEIFYGRILSKTDPTFTGQISYTAEGALSFLRDGEVTPEARDNKGKQGSRNMTAEAFFRWCIAQHNATVSDPRRQFTVGQVTVTKKNEKKDYQITNFTDTRSAIDQNLRNVYGGYLRARSDGHGGQYIDWIQEYDRLDPQDIELSVNVMELTNTLSADGVYTVLRPVGTNGLLLDQETIDLFPPEKMATMGRIVKSVTFQNADTKEKLQKLATAYAAKFDTIILGETSIRMIDMHYLDGTVPKVHIGDRFDHIHGNEGIEFTVSHMDLDFLHVENDSFSFKNRKDLEGDLNGGLSGGTISKATSRGAASAGLGLRYYHESQDRAWIAARDIDLMAVNLSEQADNFNRASHTIEIETGVNWEEDWAEWKPDTDYSLNAQVSVIENHKRVGYVCIDVDETTQKHHSGAEWNADEKKHWQKRESTKDAITNIYGTEVIQNSSQIASVAGNFEILTDYYDDWPAWEGGKEYKIGDKVKVWRSGRWFGYICREAHTSASGWTTTEQNKWNEQNGRKSVRLLDGAALTIDDLNGDMMTVGARIDYLGGDLENVNGQVEAMVGSALWTQRDNITGVSGQFEVETDPATGKKTLKIISGGGVKIRKDNTEFGLYDEDNLAGGILVDKINTVDWAAWTRNAQYPVGAKVSYHGFGYVCKTAHTSGNEFDPSKWEKYTTSNTKIVGDRIDITTNDNFASLSLDHNGLKTKVGNNETNIATLEVTVNGFDTRIESAEHDAENAAQQVSELSNTVDGMTSTVSNVDKRVSTLKNTVDGMESTVTDMSGQVSTLTNTVNGMESTVNNVSGQVSTLSNTVDGFEAKLVSVEDENGEVTAASIATAINEQGQAGVSISGKWVNISASQVKVGSTSTVAAWMSDTGQDIEELEGLVADKATIAQLTAQKARIDTLVTHDLIANGSLQVTGGDIFTTGNINAGLSQDKYIRGKTLRLIGASSSQGAQEATLSYSDVDGMIIKVAVSGNTLQLWKHGDNLAGDPSITFSKATTLTPSWSGSPVTVAAKQLNSGTQTTVATFSSIIEPKFIHTTNPDKYYISIHHADNGAQSPSEYTSTRTEFTLGTLSATPTIVRVLNAGGTSFINDTPIYTIPLQTRTLTANGTYGPTGTNIGLSSVTVNVPSDLGNAKVRFNKNGSSGTMNYYIEAYNVSSMTPLSGTAINYKLDRNGTNVQIQDTSGSQIGNTPEYAIPLQTRTLTANGTYGPTGSNIGLSSVTVNVPTGTMNPKSTFKANSGSYYIVTTEGDGGNEVSGSSKTYKLGLSGTTVQIQDSSGTKYDPTPEYTIPLQANRPITSNGTFSASQSGAVGMSSVKVNVPTGTMNPKSTFKANSGSYYIVTTEGDGGNEVSGSSKTYKLGLSGTTVQVQDASGSKINPSPEYTIPLQANRPITSNGTFSATQSGAVGMSSVNVDITPTIASSGWSGGVYTVTINPKSVQNNTRIYDLGLGTATKSSSGNNAIAVPYDVGYGALVDGQWRRGGSTGKTGTADISVYNLLQDRTVTSNDTYTANYSGGYVGLKSVKVDVTPTIVSSGWSGGVYTVTINPKSVQNNTRIYDLGLGTATKHPDYNNAISVPYDVGYGALVNGEWRRGGSTGKTGTAGISVASLLQDRTVTSNNTYTANYSSGYIGLKSVTVDVTPSVVSSTWADKICTVTIDPKSVKHYVRLHDIGLGTATKHPDYNNAIALPYDVGYQTLVNGEWRRGGSTGLAGTASVSVYSLLQDRTVTSNNTYTANYSSGYIGLKSVTVNVTPSIVSSAWADKICTVTIDPNSVKHYVRLYNVAFGTVTKDPDHNNAISIPYDVGYASLVNGEWRRGGSTGLVGTKNVSVYSFLQDKTVTSTTGTVTADYSDGYIGLKSVTLNITVPTASNISLGGWQVSASKPTEVGTYTDLTTLRDYMRNNKNTYVWFKATLSNGSGTKWYRVATPGS